jgi:hypothetical protein
MAKFLNFKRYGVTVPEFEGFSFLGYQHAREGDYIFDGIESNPGLVQIKHQSEASESYLYFVYEKNPEPIVTIHTSGKAYSIPEIKKFLPRQILLVRMTMGYPHYNHCLLRTSTKTYFQPGCINYVELDHYDGAYILQE